MDFDIDAALDAARLRCTHRCIAIETLIRYMSYQVERSHVIGFAWTHTDHTARE